MKKSDLLAKIDGAIELEEEVYPIFAEHLTTALEWAGLSETEKNKVLSIIKIVGKETFGHKIKLMQAKEYVLKETKNVF